MLVVESQKIDEQIFEKNPPVNARFSYNPSTALSNSQIRIEKVAHGRCLLELLSCAVEVTLTD